MRRRVVRHGESTLTISLPAKWTKKLGIKPKTEVDVEEEGNNLVISAEKKESTIKSEIDIKSFEKTGFRTIISHYRKGCDELRINYFDNNYLKRIEKCLSEELIGYEIVEQNKNSCLIKDVAGTKLEEFDILLRRLWLIIQSIAENCYECISKEDYNLANNIEILDKSVNKFSNYCIRILIKRGHSNYKNIPLFYRLLRGLEELSDQYKYLSLSFAKRKAKSDERIIKLLEKINENFNDFYKVFYKYNLSVLESLFISTKEILEETSSLFNKKIDHEQLHYVFNINEKIKNLLSSIIEYNAV